MPRPRMEINLAVQLKDTPAGGWFSRNGADEVTLEVMNAPSLHQITTLPRGTERRALRVAVLAPPWITVPPPGYGGIEAVVALLCDELVARGHDLTLFAAPGSHSAARVCSPLKATHADQIGSSLYESDHVAVAYDAIDRAAAEGGPFDVVHDHSGFTALAMADRVSAPVVHTLHRPLQQRHVPVLREAWPQGATRRDQPVPARSSTRRPACASPTSCQTRSVSRTGRFATTRTTTCCGWVDWTRSRAPTVQSRQRGPLACGSCSPDPCSRDRRRTSAARSSRTLTAATSCLPARSAVHAARSCSRARRRS